MSELAVGMLKWGHLFSVAVIAVLVYMVALWATMSRGKGRFPSDRQIRFMRYLYVPIAIMILAAIFISIRPIFHGVLILLLSWSFRSWIHNALAGTLVKYHQHYRLGDHYIIDSRRATLVAMGLQRATFDTQSGSLYVPYAHLQEAVVLHDYVGGQAATLVVNDENEAIDSSKLIESLFDCPLLVPDVKPQVSMISPGEARISLLLSPNIDMVNVENYLVERFPNLKIQ